MNETVAALYNITEFFSGECCWFLVIQPPQCEPSPVFTRSHNRTHHTHSHFNPRPPLYVIMLTCTFHQASPIYLCGDQSNANLGKRQCQTAL